LVCFCLHLLFPRKFLLTIFLCHGSLVFLPEHLWCLFHGKICWAMSVDHVGLKYVFWGPRSFMVTLTFFPWCKPKWSRDKFNIHGQFLRGLGTTSWCKRPLKYITELISFRRLSLHSHNLFWVKIILQKLITLFIGFVPSHGIKAL
jgi:hypothetical protein